jgi:hypothetical protein
MTKSLRIIIILICVCAVLGAAYFVILANEDPAAAGVLYKLGSDKIERIEIKNSYGSFAFIQQDNTWVVDSDGIYRTNPDKIQLLLNSLEEFSILRMLPEEKSEYGFDQPQAEVRVVTSGKKEYSFVVGATTVNASSVYIKNNEQIMLTSTAAIAQLTGSLAAYRAKDVLMVDADTIASVDYYVKGQKTLSVTNTDYQNWVLRYPFEAPAKSDIMAELVAKLRSLKIAQYVDAGTTLEEAGLASPASKLVIKDQAGVEQTLEFGAVTGTHEYVRIGAQNDIVQLYAADLDFSQLNPQSVMHIAPLSISTSEVQSLTIQAKGETDTFDLEHNGEDITARLNGTDIPFASFVSVYYKYMTLSAKGYDLAPTQPGDIAAVCTTTLINGTKIELTLLQRDTDTLYMLIDGQTKYYLNDSSLTELLYRLKTAKEKQ